MGRLSLCIMMSFYLQPIYGTLVSMYHDVILPTTYIWDVCHVSIRSDDIFYKADPTHLHLIHVSIMAYNDQPSYLIAGALHSIFVHVF